MIIREDIVDVTAPEVIIVARARIIFPPKLLAAILLLGFKAALSHHPPWRVSKSLELALHE